MTYLAHSKNTAGLTHLLKDHLSTVARLAADFATPFGAEQEAYLAGILHDLGKYGDLFQLRLQGKAKRLDHWTAGFVAALECGRQNGVGAALVIHGHHVGLHWANNEAIRKLHPLKWSQGHPEGLTLTQPFPEYDKLLGRLKADNIKLPGANQNTIYSGLFGPAAAAMLDLRMLYSTLVDADFIDTEAHFKGDLKTPYKMRPNGPALNPSRDLSGLLAYTDALAANPTANEKVNQLRQDLLNACLTAAELSPGMFTLTAPTGTGKTFAMLAFALKHAIKHNLRRIVVVIPYLSIIEQTVEEYRKVLQNIMTPDVLSTYLLEDHSLAEGTANGQVDDDDDDPQKLLAENWDAPIIVTTSVKCLESLFTNRSRRCRKLHRLAQSVILFDEVQTLPTNLAVPTLATLSRLTQRYGASVVFSTATQPAFNTLSEKVSEYCEIGWEPREIVSDELKLFSRARRVNVKWAPIRSEKKTWVALAKDLSDHPQALCVVNMKRHAWALMDELNKLQAPGIYHLSTSMCPAHRKEVLQEVRDRLQNNELCHLVSTQCIEAGVDVDFPVAYRAWGPLDAIAQVAGRCNRNGRQIAGLLNVFIPEDDKRIYPDNAYQQATNVAQNLLAQVGEEKMDINNPQIFKLYYEKLYNLRDIYNQEDELLQQINIQHFLEVAKLYRIIPNNSVNVLVSYCSEEFDALVRAVRETGLTHDWIKRARPYTVGLYRPPVSSPLSSLMEPIKINRYGKDAQETDDWFIYTRKEDYDTQKGLVPSSDLNTLIA